MAQREGSIYLYLFIASFVLFIGALVMFFVENSNKSELIGQLAAAKNQVTITEKARDSFSAKLEDLRELVGGAEKRSPNWPGNDVYKGMIKETEVFINDYLGRLVATHTDKTLNSISEAVSDLKDIIPKIYDAMTSAKEAQKRADEEKIASMVDKTKVTKEKDDVITNMQSQVRDLESKYEKRISDQTKESERLQKDLAVIKDQKASDDIQHQREVAILKNQLLALQTRLDRVLEEQMKTLTIEDIDPDGKILGISTITQRGWVNIGRKQFLRPGLDFRVFMNIKGGKRMYKGRIEIQKVDENISQFRVLEVDDDLNPISKGDFITSPFYDPKKIPVFVFAGQGLESKKITEEGLRERILSYGGKIKNDVGLDTSFLVTLKDYDKDPSAKALFKTAREMGVAILREQDVLDFMGL